MSTQTLLERGPYIAGTAEPLSGEHRENSNPGTEEVLGHRQIHAPDYPHGALPADLATHPTPRLRRADDVSSAVDTSLDTPNSAQLLPLPRINSSSFSPTPSSILTLT